MNKKANVIRPRDMAMYNAIMHGRDEWDKVHIVVERWAVEQQYPGRIDGASLTINVAVRATSSFWRDDDYNTISFKCRFSGADTQMTIPLCAIEGVFNPADITYGYMNTRQPLTPEELIDIVAVEILAGAEVNASGAKDILQAVDARKAELLQWTGWPAYPTTVKTESKPVLPQPALDIPDEELPANVIRVNFGAKR